MSVESRFWAKVDKSGDCWLWTAHLRSDSYGSFKNKETMQLAHRVSWELHFGQVPDGMCVLHRCDVRSCVRPDHLFLGTQVDNMADMVAKGRAGSTAGELSGMAKLTEGDVLDIRTVHALGGSFSAIARAYGLHHSTVRAAINGKTWGHI